MIGRTMAHCRIAAKLGDDGMGKVHHATDTKLRREVTIKILPPVRGGRWVHNQKAIQLAVCVSVAERCSRPTWKTVAVDPPRLPVDDIRRLGKEPVGGVLGEDEVR